MVKIDIEMPTYCYDCPCHNGENGRCNITSNSTYDKRPFDCPLEEGKSKIEDSISRQVAIMALVSSNDTGNITCGQMAKVLDVIKAVPSVQPERKKGKWIKMSDADGIYYCCSECGEELYRKWSFDRDYNLSPRKESIKRTNFCSYCGAEMENSNESD